MANNAFIAKSANFELVLIGTSLGGLYALEKLLIGLPSVFKVPIAIVHHRRRGSDSMLPALLRNNSRLPLYEAEDKMAIRPGTVYLAPADYHLLVEQGSFALSIERPIEYSRPSINVLFESAAFSYGSKILAVILTGANKDGAQGVSKVKKFGGRILVQDPATAESRIMPDAAIAAVKVDWIVPLDSIAEFLTDLTL